jgi:hypothetical protein
MSTLLSCAARATTRPAVPFQGSWRSDSPGLSPRTPVGPWPSRAGGHPERRCRSARRLADPAPVPGPCTAASRRSCPAQSPSPASCRATRAPDPPSRRCASRGRSPTSLVPAGVSIALPGFRSRRTMPSRCAASSAAAISRPKRRTWLRGNGPRSSRAANVSPSSSSSTRYSVSCSRPMSCKPQMCGWLSAEMALASRVKRARNSAGRQLWCEDLHSHAAVQARIACPIHLAHAPAPSKDTISYEPRRVPDCKGHDAAAHYARAEWRVDR